MGRSTQVHLIEFDYRDPAPGVRQTLGLADGEKVQWSLRRRLIDDAPFSYLMTCVPEKIGRLYTKRDLARRPLISLLEENGLTAHRATQDISAELATPESAIALGVAVGAPLTALTRVTYDADGRGIEHLRALYRPDRYTFRMELTRKSGSNGSRWSPAAFGAGRPAKADA